MDENENIIQIISNDVCNLVDYIINKSTFSTGHKFFVDGGMFMH